MACPLWKLSSGCQRRAFRHLATLPTVVAYPRQTCSKTLRQPSKFLQRYRTQFATHRGSNKNICFKIKFYYKIFSTLCCTRCPVNSGLTIPGRVATVLERPIKMLANCGAMSKGLTLNPAQANPPKPTATVRKATTATALVAWAASSRKTVWKQNAPQVQILRT
jgi:hypothetical protein